MGEGGCPGISNGVVRRIGGGAGAGTAACSAARRSRRLTWARNPKRVSTAAPIPDRIGKQDITIAITSVATPNPKATGDDDPIKMATNAHIAMTSTSPVPTVIIGEVIPVETVRQNREPIS